MNIKNFELGEWIETCPTMWPYKPVIKYNGPFLGIVLPTYDCIFITHHGSDYHVCVSGKLNFLKNYFSKTKLSSMEEAKKEIDCTLHGLSKFPAFI